MATNIQQNIDRVTKEDVKTSKTFELQREMDLDTKSEDSNNDYDSQFSDTFPPPLKTL